MTDIFVSYAHIDNQPVSVSEVGWVSNLVKYLKIEVARKLGRTDAYELWQDFELKGNDGITEVIEQQLNNANVIVLFMSGSWQC